MAGDSAEQPQYLSVPVVEPTAFIRNTIRSAACELRFPTLLQLDRKAVVAFHQPLRKVYPEAQKLRANPTEVGPGKPDTDSDVSFAFVAADKATQVTVRTYSIGIETRKYPGYPDFRDLIGGIIKASPSLIDSDFFTRVGIRYVNALPIGDGPIEAWISPELLGAAANGTFGRLVKFVQEIRGFIPDGQYTLRHGLSEEHLDGRPREYTIDLDFYAEATPLKETVALVDRLHDASYSLFRWCLGNKALDYLGSAKPYSKGK